MTAEQLEQPALADDRNVMVVWRGDTVTLCLGPNPDARAIEVSEQVRGALVEAGVDPATIVVSASS